MIEFGNHKTETVSYTLDRRTVYVTKDVLVQETFKNDVLISQKWELKDGTEHYFPNVFEPHNMSFFYYDDISFLDSDICANTLDFYDIIPDHSFIPDWNYFKGLSYVLCIYLGMDGNIYRINDANPIPLWKKQDYIGSFSNDEFNLLCVSEHLSKIDWIRNVKIVDIPYYNCTDEMTRAIEFEYKYALKDDRFAHNSIYGDDILNVKQFSRYAK